MEEKAIKKILVDFLDEVLTTSSTGISPVTGYKGITNEKEMEEQRTKDFDNAFAKTIRKLKQ